MLKIKLNKQIIKLLSRYTKIYTLKFLNGFESDDEILGGNLIN